MRRISSLIAPNAVVAVSVVSALALGAGIGRAQAEAAGIGRAQAEDCLAAPNVSSPPGQHWYYRIDRATRRHCWYLHAPLRTAHQAHGAPVVANAEIDHPAPVAPMPAVVAPMPAANLPMLAAAAPMPAADPPVPVPAPAAATDNTPSPPHVTVLAVKTVAMPAVDTRAETRSRHHVSEASLAQAAAHAYQAAPASQTEPTMFFFLVFGLGLMTFLIAIVVKRVAPQASWLLWPIRTEAEMAWPQERRNYSDAGPARLKRRAWSAQD